MNYEIQPLAWNYCPTCGRKLAVADDGERVRPHCFACNRFFYDNPVPAACCFVAKGSALLFARRAVEPCMGQWSLPGGFVEIGETAEEAVLRELEEETSIRGRNPRLIGASTQPSKLNGAVIVMGYVIDDWEGEPAARSDVTEARFFPFAERPSLPFQAHRDLLAVYDAIKRK